MLSRLVADTDPDIAPLVWGARAPLRPSPAHREPRGEAPQPAPPEGPRAEEAEAAVKRQLRQAYESGFREGQAAARQGAEDEVRKIAEKLATAVVDVAGARREVVRRAEADVVQLSVEIARRILHRELSVDASALEGLIRAALEKLSSQEVYRVRVHPEQEQLVRACLQRTGRQGEIEIVNDPSQACGGVVFEIGRGSLDASVETQLREIERGLADRLGDRP